MMVVSVISLDVLDMGVFVGVALIEDGGDDLCSCLKQNTCLKICTY